MYKGCTCVPGKREEMSKEELLKVRKFIIEKIMRNPSIMFSDNRVIDDIDLVEVIASLYELLNRAVEGEPYEYMFHWANKVCSWVNDDLFLKPEFKEDNENDG